MSGLEMVGYVRCVYPPLVSLSYLAGDSVIPILN